MCLLEVLVKPNISMIVIIDSDYLSQLLWRAHALISIGLYDFGGSEFSTLLWV